MVSQEKEGLSSKGEGFPEKMKNLPVASWHHMRTVV